MSGEIRCDGCVYWARLSPLDAVGRCRRNAPAPLSIPVAAFRATDPNSAPLWPLTLAADWCGEHAVAGEDAP